MSNERSEAQGRILRRGEPGPKKGLSFEFLSPKVGETLHMVVTSHQVFDVVTHYLDGRTVGCTIDSGRCKGCDMPQAQRWKGYLGGVVPGSGKLALAEITEGAYRSCKRLKIGGDSLRGQRMRMRRAGASPTSPVHISFELTPANVPLPDAPDVEDMLLRLWGWKS